MKVGVKVRLKESILDPQGKAVNHALHHLGFSEIKEVRIGKFVELQIEDGNNRQEIERIVKQASQKLLANPVIEDFEIEYFEE